MSFESCFGGFAAPTSTGGYGWKAAVRRLRARGRAFEHPVKLVVVGLRARDLFAVDVPAVASGDGICLHEATNIAAYVIARIDLVPLSGMLLGEFQIRPLWRPQRRLRR